jgi:hypothetical protein
MQKATLIHSSRTKEAYFYIWRTPKPGWVVSSLYYSIQDLEKGQRTALTIDRESEIICYKIDVPA